MCLGLKGCRSSSVLQLYLISKGSLKMANKQYATVKNDYEMNLDTKAVVEEVEEDETAGSKIPLIKYNFVSIADLPLFVNGRKLIGTSLPPAILIYS